MPREDGIELFAGHVVARQDSLALKFRRGRDHHHRIHPFLATGLEQQWHIDHRDRCAGPFGIEQAISLDFLEEAAKARQLTRTVLPLTAALDDIPALPVTPDQARLLRHGQMLFGIPARPGLNLAMDDQTPVALVDATDDGLKVVRGFNL